VPNGTPGYFFAKSISPISLFCSSAYQVSLALADLKSDEEFQQKSVIRGISGRPSSQTPAVADASRGHIVCDVNVDSLAYWNDPQGERDQEFSSPFLAKGDEKYISFTSDRGGWNNIRMSMEIIFVIAAATGRTLVLPPKKPLYRLRVSPVLLFLVASDLETFSNLKQFVVYYRPTRLTNIEALPTSFHLTRRNFKRE
jgi:hypothetical protein